MEDRGVKTIFGLLLAYLVCLQVQAASIENKKRTHQQPRVCSTFQELLALKQSGHAPDGFEVAWEESGGGDTTYPNLDIDRDGIDDKVVRSCGAGRDALCILFVDLSDGQHFEFEGGAFFLVRVKSSLYAIQGEYFSKQEKNKQVGKRSVYQITKQGIKRICSHI